jgi:hypothetical protein
MKAWLAAAALLLCGCAGAPPRVSLAEPSPAPTAKDYVAQLKRWTRHAQIRDDFDDALEVDATLRSPEFREAYAAKYIELYRIPSDTQPRVRGEILADGADTYEFHVETSMHNYDLNDLTSAKTIWRLSLLDDQQHEVTPSSVVATKQRAELDMEFYPYATIFSRGWTLRFPRARPDGTPLVGSETRALTLRFAGPQGSVDLVWVLK